MGEAALKLDQQVSHDSHQSHHSRLAPRATIHANVDVYSDDNFWSGLTMNMSEGGVFVATYTVVPVGTLVVLSIVVPFDDEPLVMLATVRWSRVYCPDADVMPGLGMQFVEPDPVSVAKIRRFVATTREPLLFDE